MSTRFKISYEDLTYDQIKKLPIGDEIKNPILDRVKSEVDNYRGIGDWMDAWTEAWTLSLLQATDSPS